MNCNDAESKMFKDAFIETQKQFALAISQYQIDSDMTDEEFGLFLGVDAKTIYEYENGRYNFTLKDLSELSDELGLWKILFQNNPNMRS